MLAYRTTLTWPMHWQYTAYYEPCLVSEAERVVGHNPMAEMPASLPAAARVVTTRADCSCHMLSRFQDLTTQRPLQAPLGTNSACLLYIWTKLRSRCTRSPVDVLYIPAAALQGCLRSTTSIDLHHILQSKSSYELSLDVILYLGH
jgi:hypothetical protein